MIRRSPAELYLKYLVLHPKGHTNEQIREICQFAQLDALGNWYLNRLRQELDPPEPFRPFDKNDKNSYRFLLSTGLSGIFHPDAAGKKAFEILKTPRIKEFVESSLISNVNPVAIAMAATRQYRFECDSRAIERYKSFFWNIDLLDTTELRALLQLRIDALEDHANAEIKSQHAAVKTASYKDSRRAAADLPVSPISAMIAQMRMGLSPSVIDLPKIILQSKNLAGIRTYEALQNNGRGDSTRALDFSGVLERLVNVAKEMEDPDGDLREQLATITMRNDDAALPTIHQLSQGRHTAEVVVTESTHALPAEFDDGDAGDEPSSESG